MRWAGGIITQRGNISYDFKTLVYTPLKTKKPALSPLKKKIRLFSVILVLVMILNSEAVHVDCGVKQRRKCLGACSGCSGVHPLGLKHSFPPLLAVLVAENIQPSCSLRLATSWRELLHLKSWLFKDLLHPSYKSPAPWAKAGQLGKAIPPPVLPMGSAEAFVLTALQFNSFLLPHPISFRL